MPKARKNKIYCCTYFSWKVCRRGRAYQADGRSNQINVGRHSLGTADAAIAEENLKMLDRNMAVKFGLADPAILKDEPRTVVLTLDEGWAKYQAHVQRPRMTGGASVVTWKRYRAVRDKFSLFAKTRGLAHWGQVSRKLLFSYGAWLDGEGYAESTEYLELTTIKQVVKFLIEEEHALSPDHLITFRLEKPITSLAYCYTIEEVQAILSAAEKLGLVWAADALLALTRTGLRISELAALRWSDIDLDNNMIVLSNDPATREQLRQGRRLIKNRRDRSFPIHPDLRQLLDRLPRNPDGLVLHGPLGGKLKADTLRNNLIDRILPEAGKSLRERGITTDIGKGRLHSCRHFFCSQCVEAAPVPIPEQVVMGWLGHADSKMVRRYYHLKNRQSQEYMKRLKLTGSPSATEPTTNEPEN